MKNLLVLLSCFLLASCASSWLQKHRKEYTFHDLCSSHKSLKQIAAEHDFSMANFIRYCRMNYNNTPGGIRVNLIVDTKFQATQIKQ